MVTVKQTSKNKSTGALAKSAVPVDNVSACNLDVQDALGSRAYGLHEQHGREHGNGFDEWLRAEGEVLTHLGT